MMSNMTDVRCIYDVKHDGRHKARVVAGGHLTPIPVENVYSGVVSIRSIRLVIFLAELNKLNTWGADIGNAYLEAKTKEKVYIVAGPEFGDREGHILIIHKALYGLRTSGKRWRERFSDDLKALGFTPSKADPDVWMRLNKKLDVYEYIATYVDDLLLAMEDPSSIIELLKSRFKYKIKGDGPLEYHLGTSYERDKDGRLVYHTKKYIERLGSMYEKMFDCTPKQSHKTPLEKNDHPELDETPFLNEQGITHYQSLIGGMQWVVTIGRFDLATSVMTMSRFRAAPREGHLKRARRMVGYLVGTKHAAHVIRTELPNLSELKATHHDWSQSVYGDAKEEIPKDIPEPKGKPVRMVTYKDANLYHDMVTGRAVTGILHLLNGTLLDWFSKRQNTVETATYGSEFVAARTAVDQIVDIRLTLRYLGVPIIGESIMFGDNQSVVTSATIPESALNKRHNALSYHRVREAIAARITQLHKIDGKRNPADLVSKHWGFQDAWPLMKPILFWRGDTAKCLSPTELKAKDDKTKDQS